MELYKHLQRLEAEGKPIRVGLAGCGQMGSGMVHITSRMQGMSTRAIADIDIRRPLSVFERIGISKDDICITDLVSEAEDSLRMGKYLVTEDATLLSRLESLDAVVEAT